MSTDLEYLNKKTEKNEGRIWKLEGVKNNALVSYIIVAHKKIKNEQNLKYILSDIIGLLEDMEYISDRNFDEVNDLVDALNEDYTK